MPTFSQSFLSALTNPAMSENISRAGRMLGSGPQIYAATKEKEKQKEAFKGMDVNTSAGLIQLSKYYQSLGTPEGMERAIQYSNAAVSLAQKKKETADQETFAAKLAERANNVGLREKATTESILGMSLEGRQDLLKQVSEAEMDKFKASSTLPGKKARLKQAGLTLTDIGMTEEELKTTKPEAFDKIVTSRETDLKGFTNKEGSQAIYRVNKYGLVANPSFGVAGTPHAAKEWLTPRELGLKPAITETKSTVFETSPEVNKILTEIGMEKFSELSTAAKTGAQVVTRSQKALTLVDDMYTGPAANLKLNLDRFAGLLAEAWGMEYDSSKVVNTQEYVINRLEEMANFIQKLGAGTGLSDKDAQIAIEAVAGEKTLNPETIKRLLSDFIETAQFSRRQFNKAIGVVQNNPNLTNASMIEIIQINNEVMGNQELSPEDLADSFLR